MAPVIPGKFKYRVGLGYGKSIGGLFRQRGQRVQRNIWAGLRSKSHRDECPGDKKNGKQWAAPMS